MAESIVFRTDDETDAADASLAQSCEEIIDERPADRDKRLDAGIGGGIRCNALIAAHAGAEAAGEDDGDVSHGIARSSVNDEKIN
jgi:hypothetical protein